LLLAPPRRKRPHQHRQRHRGWVPPFQNDFHDVGREQGEPALRADRLTQDGVAMKI
jgi:hypothetical protein